MLTRPHEQGPGAVLIKAHFYPSSLAHYPSEFLPDSTGYQLPIDKCQGPLLFLKAHRPLTLALSHPGTRALPLNSGREVVPPQPPGSSMVMLGLSYQGAPVWPLHTCSQEPSLSTPTNRTGLTLLPALVQILALVHMPSGLNNQRKACPSSSIQQTQ